MTKSEKKKQGLYDGRENARKMETARARESLKEGRCTRGLERERNDRKE